MERICPLPWGQQTQWAKTRLLEYTDSTFSVRQPQPEWLGILGPIMRAEVGDTIMVEFLNHSRCVHGIHPHGLGYARFTGAINNIRHGVCFPLCRWTQTKTEVEKRGL
jgi:hypothetical protein